MAPTTRMTPRKSGDWATAREIKQRYGLSDPPPGVATEQSEDARGLKRLLALLNVRRLSGSLVARLARAAGLLVLAVAGLVVYDLTVDVVRRRAAQWLLDGDGIRAAARGIGVRAAQLGPRRVWRMSMRLVRGPRPPGTGVR
jgi:hypothetical protein